MRAPQSVPLLPVATLTPPPPRRPSLDLVVTGLGGEGGVEEGGEGRREEGVGEEVSSRWSGSFLLPGCSQCLLYWAHQGPGDIGP